MTSRFDWSPLRDDAAHRLAARVLFDGNDAPLAGIPISGRSASPSFYDGVRVVEIVLTVGGDDLRRLLRTPAPAGGGS